MSKISKSIFFILSISIITYGCKKDEKNDIELTIYNNLINELLDSTIIDYRSLIVPSPSDFENEESKKNLNKRNEDIQKKHKEPLVLIINDTLKKLIDTQVIYNKISNKNHLLSVNELENKESVKFNINKLLVDKNKYELRGLSEVKDKKSNSYALVHLSRIYFDKSENNGLFTLDIVYGKLNANGVIVLIEKHNNDWIIKEIIEYRNS